MKKDYQMSGKNVIISMITLSVALTFYSFSVKANNCSISINTKASVNCLQSKIESLEEQLEKITKNQLIIPKGAIIDFNAKTCPVGWGEYQENKSGIVKINTNSDIVKCQKS
jgi:chorismate synthase